MVEINERMWLRFLWTLSLSDHIGDASEAVRAFAEKAGLPVPGDYAEWDTASDDPEQSWRAWIKARGVSKGIHGDDEATNGTSSNT